MQCTFCKHESDDLFFCDECGKILPTGGHNYFELFGIEDIADIKLNDLNTRLFYLQSKLHPDNFVGDSVEQSELSLEHSKKINDAYQILKNPIHRLEYALHLQNLDLNSNVVLPAEFLINAFELRENQMALESEEEKLNFAAEIKQEIKLLTQKGFAHIKQQDFQQALINLAEIRYLNSALL